MFVQKEFFKIAAIVGAGIILLFVSGAVKVSAYRIPMQTLTSDERAAILYMREDEKLARDVYTYYYNNWGLDIFTNIATTEQSRMDEVGALLNKYNLNDPTSKIAGVFNNPELQSRYDELIKQGSQSMLNAVLAGISIEAADILDLRNCMAKNKQGDLTEVFNNILYDTYNHLHDFSSTYTRMTGLTYQPHYLSQEEYQVIIDTSAIRSDGGNGGGGG